jgi:hypothetical protein
MRKTVISKITHRKNQPSGGVPSNKPKPTHDAKGNPIDCVHWGSHDADHHDAWKQRNKEFFANKKRNTGSGPAGNGNLAAGTESGNHTLTPMGPTEATPSVVGNSNLTMLKGLVKFK